MQPPVVGVQDEPTYCLKVNTEWISFLSGLIKRGESDGFWDTDDETGKEGIRTIQDLLAQTECIEPVVQTIERVIIQHRLPQNTAGGGTIANTWDTVPYNQLQLDDTGLVTLVNNAFTLPVGKWMISVEHVLLGDVTMNARLRLGDGSALFSPMQNHAAGQQLVHRIITPLEIVFPQAKVIQYRASDARANNGLGFPLNVAGEDEVYGTIVAWRLGVE